MIGFVVGMLFVCTVLYFWISFLTKGERMSIEGIPDGWELVRIGRPRFNERYIGLSGAVINCVAIPSGQAYAIVCKIEKPKQYRPFANAAEFEPHRDRWVVFYDSDYQALSDEKSKIMTYGDSGVWVADRTTVYEWAEAFKSWRFDDGTPFGVEVTE